ncbi:MAG: CPBP family intramembrane glutamic endopeptidase [Rikenellaceae bacterium]
MSNKQEQSLPSGANQDSSAPQQKGVWWGLFPTTVDLLAILGIFFVSQLISLALTYGFGYGFDRTALSSTDEALRTAAENQAGVFSMISYSFTMAFTIVGTLVLRRVRKCTASIAKFSILGFNPSVLLWGMMLLLSIAVVFDPLMSYLPAVPKMYGRGWEMLLTLIVIAPIAEEFLCRGIILESVRAKSGVWAACSISAIFFAVLHMHLTAAVNALVIGLVLSYLYIRTGSLFAPILLHAFNNALAYILMWLGFENITLWKVVNNKVVYFSIYAVAVFVLLVSSVKIARQLTRIRKAQKVISTEGIKL